MKIAPFKLERYFARYEFNAPYLLSSSDCESLTIADLLSLEPGAAERFQNHWLGYTETLGNPELRALIAGIYTTISPDEVVVHAGAGEAIFGFMNALLDPGDHVIVHSPRYQSLGEIALSIGCDVSDWVTSETDGWELNLDWLERSLRPNTRLIVVNCPHNPTGYVMTAETQRRLIDIARARGILLFSDEVYRELEHSERPTLPAACDLYENAVSLGVMSKTYGLPGLRIGWIATRSREIFDKMLAYKDYLTLCSSAPSEFLAMVGLRHRETLANRSLATVRANLSLLDQFFAAHDDVFNWQRPKGGSTAFPSLKLDMDVEAFCVDLVERQGVLLLPGTCYDHGARHFRIGYGRRNLPEALEHFDAYLHEHVHTMRS